MIKRDWSQLYDRMKVLPPIPKEDHIDPPLANHSDSDQIFKEYTEKYGDNCILLYKGHKYLVNFSLKQKKILY